MRSQIIALNELVVLKLSGEVNVADWQKCFSMAEEYYCSGDYRHLLVDGRDLDSFNVTHSECQKLARGFVDFAKRGAFFAEDPLIFGMVRVVHGYSNNENFGIFKTRSKALEFIAMEKTESVPTTLCSAL
jgi:hypothetical protein